MRKVILTFGLLAGAIVSVSVLIGIVIWERTGKFIHSELVGYATMVIALSMIFFGIKSYRDNYQSGAIRFWKGIQVGMLITLVASLMYAITWETYCLVRPSSSQAFVDDFIECQINEKKEKGVSAAEIDQLVKRMDNLRNLYRNPAIRFGMTLMEILPVGILITLISAGVLRKKEILPA
jgi:Protein of unknown function (DUF4199)